ncbi:TPA: hypothetical protein I7730_14145 [Vibrio vulnificus]|uniref:Uncharacterized protein n=1 Tax=Vibrio vulnificus TaxID=672 RepID=A0A8H9N157_VIBVL|nr:hypothetical protein [Vibrio vulnificus]HAS8540927.1 hypothetical protein [Vibrio vulnificus]
MVVFRKRDPLKNKVSGRASEVDFDLSHFKYENVYGDFHVLFVESQFNMGTIRPYINRALVGATLSKDAFNEESLYSACRSIDEELVKRSKISRCVVLIWKSPEGRVLVSKMGGQINCYALHRDFASYSNIMARSKESERDFYPGSGAVLPLTFASESMDTLIFLSDSLDEIAQHQLGKSFVNNILDRFFTVEEVISTQDIHDAYNSTLDALNLKHCGIDVFSAIL